MTSSMYGVLALTIVLFGLFIGYRLKELASDKKDREAALKTKQRIYNIMRLIDEQSAEEKAREAARQAAATTQE